MTLESETGNGEVAARPPGTVNEPSTWRADQLVESQWLHYLADAEINELVAATDTAIQRGLQPEQFGADDFKLPSLGARLADIVNTVENGVGFALVRGVPVQRYSEAALRVLYWGLGCYFGEAISQNSRGQLLAEVSDRGNLYADLNARGFATSAELQPHVDTSDMTTLLCVRAAKRGGQSRVVSSSEIFNTVLNEHPEFLDSLFVGFKNDLRGEGPTGDINELTHHAVPVFSYYAGRLSCSFNIRMIENAEKKSGRPFSPIERRALDFVQEVSMREENGVRFFMRPGDIQMVSNHSVLHSREQFEDYEEPERRRCLYRFWVNLPEGRALEPRFADRYNTGPRGGVAIGDGAQYRF